MNTHTHTHTHTHTTGLSLCSLKTSETRGFLMFSEVIQRNQFHRMSLEIKCFCSEKFAFFLPKARISHIFQFYFFIFRSDYKAI